MKSVATLFLAFVLVFTSLAQAQQTTPPVAQEPDDKTEGTIDQEVHRHSDKDIDNVDKIGSRNVGCNKGLGNWYNEEKQIMLGKSIANQIDASSKIVTDPVINEYVNRIGQKLVQASDAKVPFTIKVIDSDEINAFALPGGFFYVNTGLILAADNEAELAAVMAHEIAHVAACHAARNATRGNLLNLGMIPIQILMPPVGIPVSIAIRQGMGIGIPAMFAKFSRGFEAQADYLGVQYLYKAGYDPNAFITIFEKLQALDKKKHGGFAKTFESHPPTPDRIAHSQKEINSILPARDQYTITTSEFDDVKGRLAAVVNHKKTNPVDDEKKPTLRHKENSDKDDDSDHPTLKKRPE